MSGQTSSSWASAAVGPWLVSRASSNGAMVFSSAQGQLLTQPEDDADQQSQNTAAAQQCHIEYLQQVIAGLQRDVKDLTHQANAATGDREDLGRILAQVDPIEVQAMLAALHHQAAKQRPVKPLRKVLMNAASLIETQALKLRGFDVLQQQLADTKKAHEAAVATIGAYRAATAADQQACACPMCQLVTPDACCPRAKALEGQLQELQNRVVPTNDSIEQQLEAAQSALWEQKAAAKELQELLQAAYQDLDQVEERAADLAEALEKIEDEYQQAVSTAEAEVLHTYVARLSVALQQVAVARNAVAALAATAAQRVTRGEASVRTTNFMEISALFARERELRMGMEIARKRELLLHVSRMTDAHDSRFMGLAARAATHQDQGKLQLTQLLPDAPAQRLLVSAATSMIGADTSIHWPAVESRLRGELATARRTIQDLKQELDATARAQRRLVT